MVRDITKDIQQLDQAKRNLTVSITTLNNLILIVNALDRLNELLRIKPLGDETVNNDTVASQPHNDSKNPFAEDETAWFVPLVHIEEKTTGITVVLVKPPDLQSSDDRRYDPVTGSEVTVVSVYSRLMDKTFLVGDNRRSYNTVDERCWFMELSVRR
ncbi:hypothetical protein AHF37_07740 [Paragonimus kellicotti]|nr:hypothetical protein AHF37_07740 [Paragonimus kellicotti]